MKKKIKKKQKSKKQIKLEQANMQTDNVAMSSDGLQYTGSFTFDSMDPADLGDIDIGFDTLENVTYDVGTVSYDSDKDLREKYPALQDAFEHYRSVKKMCETREKEESND